MTAEPYDRSWSARIYDVQYEQYGAAAGDVEFYVELARGAGGKVLEAGCGTGRILLPMLEAGVDAAGIDSSGPMLQVLRANAAARGLEAEVHEADLRDFSLDDRFSLVVSPFRVFQHLLTVPDQKAALARVREHLVPGGRYALNVFHPSHDRLVGGKGQAVLLRESLTHPDSGNRILLWDATTYDVLEQLAFCALRYEEVDAEGKVLETHHETFPLRYFHRWELDHLAELCGFEVESAHGDFQGGPLRHGAEMVYVLRKRD
jgi:SAM-dependent methyltransferase